MKNIFFALSLLYIFAGCDSAEDVPSYVYIKPFEFYLNDNTLGTNKFSDAWVYVNGNPIGAYSVSGEVPIPSIGKTEITIYPGVRNNGSSGTPAIYFNCERFDISPELKAGKTDTIYPKIRYAKAVKFSLTEDFEQNTSSALNLNVDDDNDNNIRIVGITDGAKFGKNCGFFSVSEKSPLMAVTHQVPIQGLPSNQKVYVEVDYRGTADLQVELVGNSATKSTPLESATYSPKGEWSRAYINFRFQDYAVKDYPSFTFIFSAKLPTDKISGAYSRKDAELRIDNVRIISQP